MPKSHRPYPPEFRQRIVELVRKGRTPEELARQFEPSAQAIRNWVRQVARDAGERTDGLTTDEREEVRRLRREVKLLREEFPNGFEVGFLTTGPTVEPGLIQTTEAIAADLAKAGIRTKQRFIGEVGPFTNLVRDNKADPMFTWSWGYYSVFDADAILFDVMTCGQPYSYYCNKELDDLVIQGRSTLDSKRRAEIYVKTQKLIYDDAAYLYKWGLRGVWGISNRIEYEAPRDEIDRMFVVTPRKK